MHMISVEIEPEREREVIRQNRREKKDDNEIKEILRAREIIMGGVEGE